MKMFYYFQSKAKRPPIPDDLAHQANDTAIRAIDARDSHEALKQQIKDEVNRPINRKLMDASKNRLILVYFGLTLLFFITIIVEYYISIEIYTVLFPQMPQLIFAIGVGMAFLASICLGETSSHFRLFSLDEEDDSVQDHGYIQRTTRDLYHVGKKQKKTGKWYFHPITGVMFTIIILSLIFLASWQRVAYMEQAGEVAEDSYHQYLPVILYAFEIFLGLPALFVFLWIHARLKYKDQTKKLTQMRGLVILLRRTAIRYYTDYLSQLEAYNHWAGQHQELPRTTIVPNQELRQLLIEEFGYDPTQGEDNPPTVEVDMNDEPPLRPSGHHHQPSDSGQEQENGGDDENGRLHDLMNLMDERIDKENKEI